MDDEVEYPPEGHWWQYTITDLPVGTSEEAAAAWAEELAAQGWHLWPGRGTVVTINGRRVWRYALRRAVPLDRRTG